MLTTELPRRTISLAPDANEPGRDAAGRLLDRHRKWRRDNPLAYKRSQRIKALRISIKVCDRLIALLPGKRLTHVRELAKLLSKGKP